MDATTSGTTDILENGPADDPWAAAFAALEQAGAEASAPDTDEGREDGAATAAAGAETADGQQQLPASDEAGNADQDEVHAGGLGDPSGADGGEARNAFAGATGVTEESIKQYEDDLNESIRSKAIDEVAAEFVKRGVRNKDGALGATLDDPDICKRDSDGVPHFYNPETGQEFRGDNPRRQAQEWVDDYNKELARVFNTTCQKYEDHLREEANPRLAVMKFAPKYDKLDDIRRGMLDNVIEDYEIKDGSGNVVGYSCDLDKALALVDRQIAMIQGYAKQRQQKQQEQQAQPNNPGPALDMKTSSGAIPSGNQAPPSSLAEAMERLQDEQLSKMKR